MSRRAFTLIELLVVIAIIALLAGMVLGVVVTMRDRSLKTKTKTILMLVKQAVDLTTANTARTVAPSEHPLAGSRAPRALFVRSGTGTELDTGSTEVYYGVATSQVIGGVVDRVLLDSDVYSAGSAGAPRTSALPFLYGLARSQIGIIGSARPSGVGVANTPLETVTRYRRLPLPTNATTVVDVNGDGTYDASDYPDRLFLVAPMIPITSAVAADILVQQTMPVKQSLDAVLALGSVRSELTTLGALYTPPTDNVGDLILSGRVYAVPGETSTTWKPGMVRDAGTWKRYRLRGPALYDAWGREILYSLNAAGNVLLMSAGKDGVFQWHPGKDGAYQNDPWADPAGTINGDDGNGSTDDVRL